MKKKPEQIVYHKVLHGRCAGCDDRTQRWSITHRWYICVLCKSLAVLRSIADHVMYPNE